MDWCSTKVNTEQCITLSGQVHWMKTLKTGIAGLDEFLMGGLPPKIILLTGSPGSGNEIFARQVLFNTAKTCPITYFTVNASADSIREDMAAYGWDTTPLEESGAWNFKSLKDVSAAKLPNAVLEEMKKDRIVAVDSVSELLLTHKIGEVANLVTSMTTQNRSSKVFHLLLVTEGMQDSMAETTINHFAEGSIYFALTWDADTTMRHFIIRKMSGTIIPTRRLTYNLGRKGFIIETATRIT
jgi:KaiC/GvpD/RAD55 family RecA-like ATPase